MQQPSPKGLSSDEILSVIDLSDFAQHAVTRTFPKNTVVVSEGDRTDSLYIVVSGRVRIYVSDDKGKEIVLNESGPGEYFGEMVLDEGPRSASVMTLEPTQFLVIPDELEDKVQREFRALRHEFLEVLFRDHQELRRLQCHDRSRARAFVEHHFAEVLPGS